MCAQNLILVRRMIAMPCPNKCFDKLGMREISSPHPTPLPKGEGDSNVDHHVQNGGAAVGDRRQGFF
jgi:hypothetical protein